MSYVLLRKNTLCYQKKKIIIIKLILFVFLSLSDKASVCSSNYKIRILNRV